MFYVAAICVEELVSGFNRNECSTPGASVTFRTMSSYQTCEKLVWSGHGFLASSLIFSTLRFNLGWLRIPHLYLFRATLYMRQMHLTCEWDMKESTSHGHFFVQICIPGHVDKSHLSELTIELDGHRRAV